MSFPMLRETSSLHPIIIFDRTPHKSASNYL